MRDSAPRRALALMLGACVCFAGMASFVGAAHRADPDLHTSVASFFRSSVNLLALVLLSVRNPRALLGDGRPALWVRGLFGGASLTSYFIALAGLGIGEAAFLNHTSAVWVALLAPLFLGERTRALTWFAILGSLGGMLLLMHPRDSDLLARAAGLGSGVLACGAYLSIRRASQTNGPVAIVFYFTLTASVVTGTWMLARGSPMPSTPAVMALLVGAGLAATFGQLAMTLAYQLGPAAPLAAAGATGPLLTTLAGWYLLGQAPDARGAVGMAVLAVTGVALPFVSTGSASGESGVLFTRAAVRAPGS